MLKRFDAIGCEGRTVTAICIAPEWRLGRHRLWPKSTIDFDKSQAVSENISRHGLYHEDSSLMNHDHCN